jgi:hypothetical protein
MKQQKKRKTGKTEKKQTVTRPAQQAPLGCGTWSAPTRAILASILIIFQQNRSIMLHILTDHLSWATVQHASVGIHVTCSLWLIPQKKTSHFVNDKTYMKDASLPCASDFQDSTATSHTCTAYTLAESETLACICSTRQDDQCAVAVRFGSTSKYCSSGRNGYC